MDKHPRSKIHTRIPLPAKNIPTRRNNKPITRKLHHNQTTKRKDKIPNQTLRLRQGKPKIRTDNHNDNNLCETGITKKQTTIRLHTPTKPIPSNNQHIRKIPDRHHTTLHQPSLWMTCYVIYVRKNYFYLIIMDETKNWKLISLDDNNEPLLKYDPHRDEIVNVQSGEVIQGH